jgi:subtilisin-like proprotein convertase family protein
MRKFYLLLLLSVFTLVAQAQTIATLETEAPNNTPATAQVITSPAKIKGNVFPNADIDYYSFTAAAGDKVYAAVIGSFSSSSSNDSQLRLFASDGTTLIEFDDDDGTFGTLSSSIAGANIPVSGTYYLEVKHFSATNQLRNYDLYLKVQSGSPTAEVEANDTPATANAMPGSGWVSGARNPALGTEQDWFSVTLAAGESVFISADWDPERDLTTYNGRLGFALFGDANNQILVIDDASTTSPNSEAFVFTAKDAGTYYVFADAASAATGGPTATYNISYTKFAATSGYVNYPSADIPKTIGPGTGSVTSTLTIPDSKLIKDIGVRLDLNHALMNDIDATLTSPNGAVIHLFTDIGAAATGGQTQMNLNLNDNNAVTPAFTVLKGVAYQPEIQTKLDMLKGVNTAGIWTLTLYDDGANASGGTLNNWSLDVLEEVPPVITGATVIASEDFEASDGGFTHTGTQDEWARGTPTAIPITTANSGVNCWKTDLTGTYNASSDQILSSPSYVIPNTAVPKWLTWAMKHQVESRNFDSLRIYVEEVGNPSNYKNLFEWMGATPQATIGNPGVSTNFSAGWGTHWADISVFAGKTIQFKVKLATDNSVQLGGVAIDDVKLYDLCTAPTITADPTNTAVCSGATASFTVAASGSPAPTYQWQVDNGGGFANILGETSATLSFTTSASQNGYLYRCIATNACGSATSNPATLTVNGVPVVTADPANTSVCDGSSVTFTVTATGIPAPTYQWQVDNGGGFANIGGATMASYIFTATVVQNGFSYRCVVTNTCGSVNSAAATLTVTAAASATINYAGNPYCSTGGTAIVTLTGSAGGTYTAAPSLSINASTGAVDLAASTAGTYLVTYSINASGSCPAFSTTASITINASPTVNPVANQVVCNNTLSAPVTFSGAISGTVYNWVNSNPAIGLAANGTGNIAAFTATNAGTAPITGTITVTPVYTNTTCNYSAVQTFTNSTPTAIPTGPAVVTSTLAVSGAAAYLTDLTLLTNLTHTFAADLDITITSPAGTVVTLTTDNGAGNDNTFNGTLFNDKANPAGQVPYTTNNGLVTDHAYVNLTTATPLTPEEPLGAFIGENPNGTWTITISDDLTGDGGSLDSWSLNIQGLPSSPSIANTSVTQSTPTAIPTGPAVVTSSVVVAGAGTVLHDLNLTTFLTHTFAADLDITITSPAGTVVTLTTDNGAGNDNVFNGTIWNDNANPAGQVPYTTNNGLVTDHAYVNLTPVATLTPEEPLAAFRGEDPNGTWTITVSDDLAGDGGSLDSWILDIQTASCAYTCTGTPVTYTYTVNPTPIITPVANQTVCNGAAIPPVNFTVSTTGGINMISWTNSNPAIGIPASGTGNIFGFTGTNATNAPISGTITVTPQYSNGSVVCTGPSITYTVTVNPTATVNAVANQTVCNGSSTAAITFSSPTTGGTIVYNWTNNTPSIGLAASGTGNIAAFTGANATNAPVTATITVTPSYTNGVTCTGTPRTFTITVNPTATVNAVANQIVCNGTLTAAVAFTSPTTGGTIVYNWTNNTPSIGLAASGSGNIAAFTATNTTSAPVIATITVTPSYTNGVTCTGTPRTFTITVNPTPNAVATPASQTICSGTAMTTIVLSGNVAGTTFNWTRDNTTNVTGIANSGSGNISGTPVNNTTTQQTVTYTITPIANGCPGTPITATLIVNKAPTIVCPANIIVNSVVGTCAAPVTYTPTVTGSPAPTLTYSLSGATTGSGSGSGSGLSFNVGVTTVTVTATNTCATASCSFTITVNDSQLPVITAQPVNRTVCVGQNASFSVTAVTSPSANGPLAYQWQQWNGSAWVNVTGATASTYTVNSATVAMNTNTFRVVVTGLCTTINSGAATLFVNPLPTITIDAVTHTGITPGQTTTLVATANPPGGNYLWRLNGGTVSSGTAATYGPLTVDNIGAYSVVYTDPNGCTSTSNTVNITGLASENVWIYPNPNNGQFTVRFYNQTNEKATIMVYDVLGQVMQQKVITTGITYSSTVVDLGPTAAAGVYIVKVVGTGGRELAAKRIIVYR